MSVTTLPRTPLDRLKKKQPRQLSVGIFLDESPADRLDAAVLNRQQARQQAQALTVEDLKVLDRAVEDAQAALDAETIWFTFRGIGRTRFAQLLAEHPPTDEDRARATELGHEPPEYHGATFAPAVIAVTCVSPALTLETVQDMYADEAWNEAELGALVAAALAVNTRARTAQIREHP